MKTPTIASNVQCVKFLRVFFRNTEMYLQKQDEKKIMVNVLPVS